MTGRVAVLEDGTRLSFPAGTPDDVMDRAVQEHLAPPAGTPAVMGNAALRGLSGAAGLVGDLASFPRRLAAGVAERLVPGDVPPVQPPTALGAFGRFTAPQDGSHPLSSTNIQRGLRDVGVLDQPGTQPRTEGQRYLAAASEGAGGGALFGPLAALLGFAGGAAGEGAANVAQRNGAGETATEVARLGGNIAGGVGGATAGRALGRVIAPVQTGADPVRDALVAQARAEGIPVTPGQATGSRTLRSMESVFADLPMTAGRENTQRVATSEAFTRNALGRAGVQADRATPDVLAAAQQRIGQEIGDIAGRNTAAFPQPVLQNLRALEQEVTDFAGPNVQGPLLARIRQVQARIDPSNTMAGRTWHELDSELAAASRGATGVEQRYLGRLRDVMGDAMEAGAGQADAAALRAARGNYRNLITIEEAMGARGVGSDIGLLAPTSLRSAAIGADGRRGFATGRGDFNDLARIGTEVVRDPIPNSGTSLRSFMTNLLTAGGAGGAAAAAGASPVTAGLAAGSMLLPRAVQGAYYSRPGQLYLSNPGAIRSPLIDALSASTGQGAAVGATTGAGSSDTEALRRAVLQRLMGAE